MNDQIVLILSDKLLLDIQLTHTFMPNMIHTPWLVSNIYAPRNVCVKYFGSFASIFSSCKVWRLQNWENFRLKLSHLHKANTCWTENCWSSGIMIILRHFCYFRVKNFILYSFFTDTAGAIENLKDVRTKNYANLTMIVERMVNVTGNVL